MVEKQLRSRNCPLCHSEQKDVLSKLDFPLFDGTPISGKVDLVSCASCGFVYYDTPSTSDDFDEFYREHYPVNAYDLRNRHPAESAYLIETVQIMLRGGVKKDAFVVDVGCGPGHLLSRMKSAGFKDILGIELCQAYVDEMSAQGIPARNGSAMDLQLDGRLADCLIFKNIFEHFLDFDSVLDQIEKHLAPDGFVMIEVPDASRYAEFSGYSPLSYFTLEHVNHFDPHHLRALFQRRGFDIALAGSRLLDIVEKYPVPIQHGLFQRAGVEPPDCDQALGRHIRHWLAREAAFISPELSSLAARRVPVHVWGLSYRTLAWLGMSPLKDCLVAGCYDSDPAKQMRTLSGSKVLSSALLKQARPDEAVVIGVGPSSESMKRMLTEEWKFLGEIILLH
jgi:2-polyprenyl-3-methyl-5-hydroxy-6-metoxy-1,4-benzoquinol methylase